MRYIVACIAALATCYIPTVGHAAAVSTNAATRMAQEPPAEIWYIHGVVTFKDGERLNTQYTVSKDGEPVLLMFGSQAACEKSRASDPEIVQTLMDFEAKVAEAGATAVVSCDKLVRP